MLLKIFTSKTNKMKNKTKQHTICCGVLEQMTLGWIKLEDGTKCAPFVYGKGIEMLRVNHCPSCGKYVRNEIIGP